MSNYDVKICLKTIVNVWLNDGYAPIVEKQNPIWIGSLHGLSSFFVYT